MSSRKDDPWTSKAAAKEAESSGLIAKMQQHVLELVKTNPSKTARELADLDPTSRDNPPRVHRRLSEIERKGMIHRGPERKCEITDRMATTWIPGPEAKEVKPVQRFRCLDCGANGIRPHQDGPEVRECRAYESANQARCGGRLICWSSGSKEPEILQEATA